MSLLNTGQVDESGNSINEGGISTSENVNSIDEGNVSTIENQSTEIGDGGNNSTDNPNWSDHIDESLRKRIGKFKDVNSLAKSYVELEKKLSEGFKVPETEEELNALYAKLGRPEDPSGYDLGDIQDEIGFRNKAYETGLSQTQAESLSRWFNGLVEKHQESLAEKSKAAEVALRERWGEKFNDNLELANRELTSCFSQDFIDRLEAGGFLNDQEFITVLYQYGKAKANDSIGKPGLGVDVERTAAGQPFLNFPSMKQYE